MFKALATIGVGLYCCYMLSLIGFEIRIGRILDVKVYAK